VPGLNVARIDANKWAISARGFNGQFANKMLVLIDGRSVYTPLFSGVYWDVQDTLLADIERIEVIRGPGATLWGANAVNGVINIITKSAKETQGGLLTVGGGSEETGLGSLRYGGPLGKAAHYRIYTKYFNRTDQVDGLGRSTTGQWAIHRGGFRLDWQASRRDAVTFQGDLYHGSISQQAILPRLSPPFTVAVNDPADVGGLNLLTRWSRSASSKSDFTLQFYYDRTQRFDQVVDETRNTYDLDLQHHLAAGRRHDLVWGLGLRYMTDQFQPVPYNTASMRGDGRLLLSGFLQDDMALVKGQLRLTLGTKIEQLSKIGTNYQPNGRLLWTPNSRHTLWAAVSRAVRTPSRAGQDVRLDLFVIPEAFGPVLVSVFGNEQIKPEVLRAHEVGYRLRPSSKLSIDLAAFYNVYNRLLTFEVEPPLPVVSSTPPHILLPVRFGNQMRGETYGAEAAANWNVNNYWTLGGGYSLLRMQLHRYAGSQDTTSEEEEGVSPRHQVHLRTHFRVLRKLELSGALYHVSTLARLQVPSYTRLDARVEWQLTEQLNLSGGVNNLLDPRHPEFGPPLAGSITQIKRNFYAKGSWRF
jgi:iron complex outermembrane recepter protein